MFSHIVLTIVGFSLIIAPFLHWVVECFRVAVILVHACDYNGSIAGVEHSMLTPVEVCQLLHPEFVYVCCIFVFVVAPLLSAAIFGLEQWDGYIDVLQQLHDRFILAMFHGSAITLFLLSVFLVTWLLGYGIFDESAL